MKTSPPYKTSGFIERTILAVVSIIKETVSNDEIAGRNGFLQKRDPRVKCLSVTLMLVTTLLSTSTVGLAGIYTVTLVLVLMSSIGLGYYLKRTLLFIPLFSFFIVVPAIFSCITPGEPLYTIAVMNHPLSITRQGIDSAVVFFLRVLVSVSLAVLLVLTTRHHLLLKALRVFKVPQLFVMTLGMCYRYIYLLLDIIQNTYTAIRSRAGFIRSARTGRRTVAASMAGLWLKSYTLQTQTYDAMLSRGYTGEPRVLEDFRVRPVDIIILAAAGMALCGSVWLNLYTR